MKYRYPVSVSCGVLEVSASGYFNWLRRREDGHGRSGPGRLHSDEALLAHIRAIHAEVKGEYGWPRMHKELVARGIRVGKDRVRKLMQQHGIKAKTKRKFVVTTDSRHSLPVAPDLVQRRFNPEAPDAKTTIKTWLQQPGMLGMRFSFHIPVLQQPLAGWGQLDTTTVAVEQPAAELAFQALDPRGDGGLGDMEFFRGGGEAATTDDFQESAGEIDVHGPIANVRGMQCKARTGP